MRTRAAALSLAASLLLAGCSQVQDAATSAASNAASQAASGITEQAKSVAAAEAVRRICSTTTGTGPLADGKVTAEEKAAIASLSSLADSTGIVTQIAGPLADIARSRTDAEATAALGKLKQACAKNSPAQ